jgi:dihydropteroate synthase
MVPSPLELPGGRFLSFGNGCLVMGIVNATPDSFFPGSRATSAEAAVERALEMEAEGAAIIDIGGESTRPGAAYVDAGVETARVVPVVEGIRKRSPIPISIDTRKATVARAALDAGADIVNDISALEDDPELGPLVASRGAALVLMHKKGNPGTMQEDPAYDDVAAEIAAYLGSRAAYAVGLGIAGNRIVLDPGIGFGKRVGDNLAILAKLAVFLDCGYPVLVGLSRKSFLGEITGRPAADRLQATTAAHCAAVLAGASILRVHDVAAAVDAVRVARALAEAGFR